MEIIKCLSEKIEDELQDAADYVDLAMKWKQDEPETADLFYALSIPSRRHGDKKCHASIRTQWWFWLLHIQQDLSANDRTWSNNNLDFL